MAKVMPTWAWVILLGYLIACLALWNAGTVGPTIERYSTPYTVRVSGWGGEQTAVFTVEESKTLPMTNEQESSRALLVAIGIFIFASVGYLYYRSRSASVDIGAVIFCVECGAKNPSTYQYCGKCGARLEMK
jgi:hypothetical protein